MSLLENSAVGVHAEATACFDFGFEFHVSSPFRSVRRCLRRSALAIRIHDRAAACFNVGFGFHVGPPIQLTIRIHTNS